MGAQTGVQALGAKVGVSLTLTIDNRLDIAKQSGQVLLGAFAAAQGEGIQAGDATVEFVEPFADGLAVLAQGAFSEAVTAVAEFLDGAGEQASAVGAFECFRGLDQPGLACVSQLHYQSLGSRRPSILPRLG